jgi:hypothetical protein
VEGKNMAKSDSVKAAGEWFENAMEQAVEVWREESYVESEMVEGLEEFADLTVDDLLKSKVFRSHLEEALKILQEHVVLLKEQVAELEADEEDDEE